MATIRYILWVALFCLAQFVVLGVLYAVGFFLFRLLFGRVRRLYRRHSLPIRMIVLLHVIYLAIFIWVLALCIRNSDGARLLLLSSLLCSCFGIFLVSED
jgi:hypothetical protein